MKTVLCLCCGERYLFEENCPNVEDGEHDAARAVAVARYLRDTGLNDPTPEDVRDARAAVILKT